MPGIDDAIGQTARHLTPAASGWPSKIFIAASLLGDLHWANRMGTLVALVHGVSLLIAAVFLLKRSAPTGRLMLLTGAFFLFHTILRVLEYTGLMPEWIVQLGIDNAGTNPILALVSLGTNLAVLTGWIVLVARQRKNARDKLAAWQAQEQERLKDEVARQTAALNKALQYADEKNRQKTETLGYISHDLRAPLATIVGYAQLLKNAQTPDHALHVQAIERSANYQLGLIDELVEYAKNDIQPLELKPAPIHLTGLLKEIVLYATTLSAQQNNQFQCDVSTPLPATALLDGPRLTQVLLNLLSNAAKFTHGGTICLSVSARRSDADWLLDFAVNDSGIGINPLAQPTIFNAFSQVQSRKGSVGLGLFIAQRIVENMGGQLALASSPGQGSCFSFQIRLTAADAATVLWSPADCNNGVLDEAPAVPAASSPLLTSPPAYTRVELAELARDGQLTGIENWL